MKWLYSICVQQKAASAIQAGVAKLQNFVTVCYKKPSCFGQCTNPRNARVPRAGRRTHDPQSMCIHPAANSLPTDVCDLEVRPHFPIFFSYWCNGGYLSCAELDDLVGMVAPDAGSRHSKLEERVTSRENSFKPQPRRITKMLYRVHLRQLKRLQNLSQLPDLLVCHPRKYFPHIR